MSTDFARRILEHFRDGGTLEDGVIEDLYRSAHCLPPGTAPETEAIRRWAYDIATRLDLKQRTLQFEERTDAHSSAFQERLPTHGTSGSFDKQRKTPLSVPRRQTGQ